MTEHAALVLAAGAGARMGYAKQRLTRDGESLLRRTARLALETRPSRCLVVLGAEAEGLRPLLDGLDVEIILNPHWHEGMGSSLDSLRQALRDDHAIARSLILGCDQPALEAAHLHQLLDTSGSVASGCVVSGYDGVRGIPAVVPQHLWEAVPLGGDRGLRQLFARLDVDAVACVAAPALALDVDTPADVAAAVARGWLDPPHDLP